MILYLDLDGVLKSDINALANHGKVHNITENWRGEEFNYSFIERPNLNTFLAEVKEQGWVINLATMGHRSYAIKCLEAMGISDYFTKKVCGVELRRPDQCSNFTIVDDRPELLEFKADQISHHFFAAKINKILVPSYLGGYDDELLKLSKKLLDLKTVSG